MHWHSRPQRQRPKPSPNHPPRPGPYGAHPGQNGQAAGYYNNHPQRPVGPPPSAGPYTLILRPTSKQLNAPETLTPNDRQQPLFTIHHKPHSFSSQPNLRVTQHGTNAELGSVQLHHFSSRVDLTPANGTPPLSYKSNTPLPSTATPHGETWVWKADRLSSGDKGPYVARLLVITDRRAQAQQNKKQNSLFSSRGKKGEGQVMAVAVLEGSLTEGAVQVHRKELERGHFELLVMTAVVQLQELRRKVKEKRVGGSGMAGGGGNPVTGGGGASCN